MCRDDPGIHNFRNSLARLVLACVTYDCRCRCCVATNSLSQQPALSGARKGHLVSATWCRKDGVQLWGYTGQQLCRPPARTTQSTERGPDVRACAHHSSVGPRLTCTGCGPIVFSAQAICSRESRLSSRSVQPWSRPGHWTLPCCPWLHRSSQQRSTTCGRTARRWGAGSHACVPPVHT